MNEQLHDFLKRRIDELSGYYDCDTWGRLLTLLRGLESSYENTQAIACGGFFRDVLTFATPSDLDVFLISKEPLTYSYASSEYGGTSKGMVKIDPPMRWDRIDLWDDLFKVDVVACDPKKYKSPERMS